MYSYSALKDFKQCPKLFYEKRVAKSVKFVPTDATRHGEALHKAFELYVQDGTPLPEEFIRHEPMLQDLVSYKGIKACELVMAVDGEFKPVPYYTEGVVDPKPWDTNKAAFIGGIADLLLIDPDDTTATYIDYKSGKGAFPDTEQCELMSLMVMLHFPHILEVKSALLFVEAGKMVETKYTRDKIDDYISNWRAAIARVEQAKAFNVWNCLPGPLCGWCQVLTCDEKKFARRR